MRGIKRWNDGRLAGVTHTATTTRVRARERRREVGDLFANAREPRAPRLDPGRATDEQSAIARRAKARATPTRTSRRRRII